MSNNDTSNELRRLIRVYQAVVLISRMPRACTEKETFENYQTAIAYATNALTE